MIWDRWDDAMDDLDRDESAVLGELVLALDRHPELDLVAGSALAFGTRVRRPDDAPPDAHGIANWRPGLAAWSPEFSLHRDDGQVLRLTRMLAAGRARTTRSAAVSLHVAGAPRAAGS